VSNEEVSYLVVGACALGGLAAYVALILVPAWGSYGRLWERMGAAFLSLYVLLAFVMIGAGVGLGVAWFWDRIQG
jgi:hypothetical protein